MSVIAEPRALTTDAERDCLRSFAENGVVLEVGSYDGASALAMAESAEIVHCVDPFVNYGGDLIEPSLERFLDATRRRRANGRIVLHLGRSDDVLPLMRDRAFTLVFIDGDHTAEQFRRDVAHGLRMLARGGTLAVHDFDLAHPQIHAWGRTLTHKLVVDSLLVVLGSSIDQNGGSDG